MIELKLWSVFVYGKWVLEDQGRRIQEQGTGLTGRSEAEMCLEKQRYTLTKRDRGLRES